MSLALDRGINVENPRIAPLVEEVLADDEGKHVTESPAVRYGLAVNEWPVVDMQMEPTTLRNLSRVGQAFLNAVMQLPSSPHDYSRLVDAWALPQCLIDRWVSTRTRASERPKTLMYTPQYGVDNQMVAFTHAAALAQALHRATRSLHRVLHHATHHAMHHATHHAMHYATHQYCTMQCRRSAGRWSPRRCSSRRPVSAA